MSRGYQTDFSLGASGNYQKPGRQRKARTMVAVLADYLQQPLEKLRLLNVGGSVGIIDDYLAEHFRSVTSIDIDRKALARAAAEFQRANLTFQYGDALAMPFENDVFDIVVCSQVYEHVPSPESMMSEIYRVLAPGGICYFAASNRLMWNEPHYHLPLLSVIPRPLAHLYVRLSGKATHYHELHYSYWGLKKLVSRFAIHDYTTRLISEPQKFNTEYMVKPGSRMNAIARLVSDKLPWITPGYVWLLEKPANQSAR